MNEEQLEAIGNYTLYHHKIWSGLYDTEDTAWVDDLGAYYDNRLTIAGVDMFLDLKHHKCFCFVVDDFVMPITDVTWSIENAGFGQ